MICFTIALRGKNSTSHWDNVEKDFNNTLRSIFNQTSDSFEVYVACNDIPKLTQPYDNRLHFIQVKTQPPSSWVECCRDRAWKQLVCAHQIFHDFLDTLQSGKGIFVFPVDADDYISNQVAEYVNNHPNSNGFKSKDGYRLIKGNHIMEITPYYGGTMNIMKLYLEDLPESLPDPVLAFDKTTCGELNDRYPVRWNDVDIQCKFSKIGRKFSTLPFRSTIYVVGTGENISNHDPKLQRKNTKKRIHFGILLRKLNPFNKKFISTKVKKEFGLL